jgi:hypothetical protein
MEGKYHFPRSAQPLAVKAYESGGQLREVSGISPARQTTERYAHLGGSPVPMAVNAISGRIGSELRKEKTEAA